MDHGKEIKCQFEALKILSNNDIEKVSKLLEDKILAVMFRDVMNRIEDRYNRIPTPKELLFISAIMMKNKKEVM